MRLPASPGFDEEEFGVPSFLLGSDVVDLSGFNEGRAMACTDAFIEPVAEKAENRDLLA